MKKQPDKHSKKAEIMAQARLLDLKTGKKSDDKAGSLEDRFSMGEIKKPLQVKLISFCDAAAWLDDSTGELKVIVDIRVTVRDEILEERLNQALPRERERILEESKEDYQITIVSKQDDRTSDVKINSVEQDPGCSDIHLTGNFIASEGDYSTLIVKTNNQEVESDAGINVYPSELRARIEEITYCKKGIEFYVKKDGKNAIKHFEKALKQNPECPQAHEFLGLIYCTFAENENPEKAKTHLEKAIEINPNDRQMHYWLGKTQLKLGDSETAVKCFQRALEICPNYLEAELAMKYAYPKKGEKLPEKQK